VKEPFPLELTVPEAALAPPALAVGVWYFLTKGWLANNLLGLSLSIVGIEAMSLGSMQTAGILLTGLFFYDIFWVFCTPVMVSVAKNFEAPIKLLFPRSSLRAAALAGEKAQFAMLGLGDIVLPGLFVALCLRFDAQRQFRSSYFQTVFWAYCGGVAATIVVMNVFKAAQPALLYIVPAVRTAPRGARGRGGKGGRGCFGRGGEGLVPFRGRGRARPPLMSDGTACAIPLAAVGSQAAAVGQHRILEARATPLLFSAWLSQQPARPSALHPPPPPPTAPHRTAPHPTWITPPPPLPLPPPGARGGSAACGAARGVQGGV
jgi:hypothetical protein